MSVTAYLLINTQVQKSSAVAAELKKIKGVEFSDSVTGPVDVIVRVRLDDMKALGELVINEVQSVDGIKSTITCIAVE